MATAGTRRPTRKGCPNRAVEFKRSIAAAACAPGISVAKLALEHGVNANLLFKWRRDYRAGKFGVPESEHAPEPSRPELAAAAITLLPVQAAAASTDALTPLACIEIVFRTVTVRICGAPEVASLRVVLDTLARHS
jgi:transposase